MSIYATYTSIFVVAEKTLDAIIPHMANLTSSSYSIPTILAAVIELPISTLIIIALVLLTLYCWPVWTRHRYPPGPWPLPFVGHFPWMFVSKNSSEWLAGKFSQDPRFIFGKTPYIVYYNWFCKAWFTIIHLNQNLISISLCSRNVICPTATLQEQRSTFADSILYYIYRFE